MNNLLEQEILANNICTKKFLDPEHYLINFQGIKLLILKYLFELFRLQDVASQHVSMALRNNDRFQVTKPLPDVGGQLRKCYYLVKDVQEPKVQKILSWTDFGPFKSLDDKTLQSLAKSLVSLEVNICWFVHHIMSTFLLSQSFSIHSLRVKSS